MVGRRHQKMESLARCLLILAFVGSLASQPEGTAGPLSHIQLRRAADGRTASPAGLRYQYCNGTLGFGLADSLECCEKSRVTCGPVISCLRESPRALGGIRAACQGELSEGTKEVPAGPRPDREDSPRSRTTPRGNKGCRARSGSPRSHWRQSRCSPQRYYGCPESGSAGDRPLLFLGQRRQSLYEWCIAASLASSRCYPGDPCAAYCSASEDSYHGQDGCNQWCGHACSQRSIYGHGGTFTACSQCLAWHSDSLKCCSSPSRLESWSSTAPSRAKGHGCYSYQDLRSTAKIQHQRRHPCQGVYATCKSITAGKADREAESIEGFRSGGSFAPSPGRASRNSCPLRVPRRRHLGAGHFRHGCLSLQITPSATFHRHSGTRNLAGPCRYGSRLGAILPTPSPFEFSPLACICARHAAVSNQFHVGRQGLDPNCLLDFCPISVAPSCAHGFARLVILQQGVSSLSLWIFAPQGSLHRHLKEGARNNHIGRSGVVALPYAPCKSCLQAYSGSLSFPSDGLSFALRNQGAIFRFLAGTTFEVTGAHNNHIGCSGVVALSACVCRAWPCRSPPRPLDALQHSSSSACARAPNSYIGCSGVAAVQQASPAHRHDLWIFCVLEHLLLPLCRSFFACVFFALACLLWRALGLGAACNMRLCPFLRRADKTAPISALGCTRATIAVLDWSRRSARQLRKLCKQRKKPPEPTKPSPHAVPADPDRSAPEDLLVTRPLLSLALCSKLLWLCSVSALCRPLLSAHLPLLISAYVSSQLVL